MEPSLAQREGVRIRRKAGASGRFRGRDQACVSAYTLMLSDAPPMAYVADCTLRRSAACWTSVVNDLAVEKSH